MCERTIINYAGAILIAVVAAILLSPATRAQDKESLTFFLPSKENAITEQIVDLWETIGEKIGIPITVTSVSDAPPDVDDDGIVEWAVGLAKSGKIDITILAPTGLFRLQEEGLDFIPVATYEIDKSKYDKPCVMVKKGSPLLEVAGAKERLEALKGKKVGIGHGLKSNPIGDMILLDHGITTKSFEFFDYTGGFGGQDNKIAELLAGDIDAFLTFKVDLKFVKDKDTLKQIEPLVCGNEYTNSPLIFNRTMDFEVMKKIRGMILKIHKDKDFPQLKFLFVAINGKFVPVAAEDYDSWRTVYEKGRKEGWINDIGEAMYPQIEKFEAEHPSD